MDDHPQSVTRRLTLRAVVGALTATGAGVLPVFLLGALVVQMRENISITTFGLGAATAAFFTVSAFASVSAGWLVERLDWARSVWLTALLAAIPLVLVATLAEAYWQLLALFLVAGLGNAIAQPAANLALVRGVRRGRQGIAFGIKQASIPGGTLLAGMAVPLVALTVGWQWAFAGAAVIIVLLCAAVPLADRPPINPGGRGRRAAGVSRDHALRWMALSCTCNAMGINPLATFLVDSSVARGIATGTAGVLLASAGVFGVVSRLLVGWYTDAHPQTSLAMMRDMAVMMALSAPGFFLLGAFGGNVAAVVVALVLAAGFGYAWSGIFNFVVVTVWTDTPAAATGVTQTGLWVGATAGPLLFGLIAERAYELAWYVGGAFVLTGALCLVAACRLLARREPSPVRRHGNPGDR